jgi:hypothetical protein
MHPTVPLVDRERTVRCCSQCHVIVHTSRYLGRPGVQLAVPRGNMYPGLLVDRECKARCYGSQCHVMIAIYITPCRLDITLVNLIIDNICNLDLYFHWRFSVDLLRVSRRRLVLQVDLQTCHGHFNPHPLSLPSRSLHALADTGSGDQAV